MPHPPQDEPLDFLQSAALCRGCGQHRVLCAFGQCVACHYDSSKQGRLDRHEPVGELCCGWYATGKLDEPWTCPTCRRVHR